MLKTDVINVSVAASPQNSLRFEHELELMILRVGEKSEWILPKVLNAYMDSYEIVAKPDSRLTSFLTFNSDSNTMFYDDLDCKNQQVGQFLKI